MFMISLSIQEQVVNCATDVITHKSSALATKESKWDLRKVLNMQ
jgi:hypothetical protein